MKKMTLIVIAAMIFGPAFVAVAADNEDYPGTISMFKGFPEVAPFFKNAYGYAVFPTIGKAGWFVGGSYGKGQVYRGGAVTGKTSVIEGSIGLQFGGQAFSQIIFFQDKRAYDKFTSGNFEFDATAQAVVMTAGAQASAGTAGATAGANVGSQTGAQAKTNYFNGMATFVQAKGGAMFEASIGGQKFTFDPL